MTLLGVLLAVIVVLAVVAGLVLLATANRLDRLHVRVDAGWAALNTALLARAAVARGIASAARPGQYASELHEATERAESAPREDREAAENVLTVLLADVDRDLLPSALAAQLADTEHRLVIARRVHNDAVRDTLTLRGRRRVRYLRLAGTASRPGYFEIAALVPRLPRDPSAP